MKVGLPTLSPPLPQACTLSAPSPGLAGEAPQETRDWVWGCGWRQKILGKELSGEGPLQRSLPAAHLAWATLGVATSAA